MILRGSESQLFQELKARFPEADERVPMRSEMLPYQRLALWGLVRPFNRRGARILEIGTALGASALVMARAAPLATIVTLTISAAEAALAWQYLSAARATNARIGACASWDYWKTTRGDSWDVVFVDGDHNQIERDMVWWNDLVTGGLFLCHDYSPAESSHPSPIVYEALNNFGKRLGRPLDVAVIDDGLTGLAGWYRREGEEWAV